MHLVEVAHEPADRRAMVEFVDDATHATGVRPLSDHLWLDLRTGAPLLVTVSDQAGIAGLAQISAANDNSALEVVIRPTTPDDRARALRDDLVETAVDAYRASGGGVLSWWVDDPEPGVVALARRLGLEPGRALHELRRSLPLGRHAEITTRSFVVGQDEPAWLEVNNRAFAGHGEQGGWTAATLAARFDEPWFDADGFRLHERDGRLAGFCWTKLHTDLQPTVGEIYVIAVDPDFHGLGLGTQLTLAGLDSIHGRGVTVANLYVDADNAAALRRYDRLGFARHRTRRVFGGRQPATPTRTDASTETA